MGFCGNDIVWLNDPLLRSPEKMTRWCQKVCTSREKNWIFSREDRHIARWFIWSCKESAYKILIKRGVKPFLNARKIEIVPQEPVAGKQLFFEACFKDWRGYGVSFLTEEYACSYCFESLPSELTYSSGIHFSTHPDFRSELHQKLAGSLREQGIHLCNIQKNEKRIPQITCRPPYTIDISFSHHFPFSSYLYQIQS
jgi:phosphopantetheinyl transferase (holo-ACP synthase)